MKRVALGLLLLLGGALVAGLRWAQTGEQECLRASNARFVRDLMGESSEARARDRLVSTAERLGYELHDCRGDGLKLECGLAGYCGLGSSLGSTVCFVFDSNANLLTVNSCGN